MKFCSLLLMLLLMFVIPVFAQDVTTDIEGLEVTVVEKATDSSPAPAETIATESTVLTPVKSSSQPQEVESAGSEKSTMQAPAQKTVLRRTTLTRATSSTASDTAQATPVKQKAVVEKKIVTKKYESPFASSDEQKKKTVTRKKKTVVKKKTSRFNSSAKLSEAKQLLKAGEPKKAKEVIELVLPRVKGEELDKAKDILAAANSQLLFGTTDFPGLVEHKVKSGESLYVIAKKYGTTPEFIAALNNIKGTVIFPNQKLKVVSVPVTINVSKSKNRLELYMGKELIRTYPVATGSNNSSPVGTFTVVTKVENPTWYKTGAIVPPGDKENILGTRWLGFSLKGFGIHGTTIPESIGTQSTAGCVRMKNQDVEELYAMVPMGSVVTTVD